ncbi:MAG: metallophosphoesterase family protein [Bacteroidota bacterium]
MGRIAIVSDIHANIYALRAFLRLLADLGGVEHVLNLGDFVMLGPHPRQVAEIILSDARFINIAGNHEDNVLQAYEPAGAFADGLPGHTQWTRQQLGPELLAPIAGLPRTRIVDLCGRATLMEHALLYGPWERAPYYREEPAFDTARSHSDVNPDLVLFGHTHRRVFLERRDRLYLNPGTLGCTPGSAAYFCLAEGDGRRIDFAFKQLPYDLTALRHDFLNLGVPFRNEIMTKRYGMTAGPDPDTGDAAARPR